MFPIIQLTFQKPPLHPNDHPSTHVTCQMSHVTCHVSNFTCHLNLYIFFLTSRWRVCYQRGLPRQVNFQIYTKISSLVGFLANIGIGLMLMCMISTLVITLNLWFEHNNEEEEDQKEAGQSKYYLEHVMKALIGIEGMVYIIANIRLLRKWVSFIAMKDA